MFDRITLFDYQTCDNVSFACVSVAYDLFSAIVNVLFGDVVKVVCGATIKDKT